MPPTPSPSSSPHRSLFIVRVPTLFAVHARHHRFRRPVIFLTGHQLYKSLSCDRQQADDRLGSGTQLGSTASPARPGRVIPFQQITATIPRPVCMDRVCAFILRRRTPIIIGSSVSPEIHLRHPASICAAMTFISLLVLSALLFSCTTRVPPLLV